MVVKSGDHKGLRGRVTFSDDNIVKLELQAKELHIVLPRDQVELIKDPTKNLPYKNDNQGP